MGRRNREGRWYAVSKRDAEVMLEWHGGMGSAVYSVGSRAYAGHLVDEPTLVRAIEELRTSDVWQKHQRSQPRDRRLPRLIKTLEAKLAVGPVDGLDRCVCPGGGLGYVYPRMEE